MHKNVQTYTFKGGNVMKLNQIASNTKNNANPILAGLSYTFIIILVAIIILGLLLYFTSFSDTYLPHISYIVTAISIIIGGYTAARRTSEKGWYYGGITGVIYGIILIIIAFLAFNVEINFRSLILVILTFLFGAFGGIFGVNSKK